MKCPCHSHKDYANCCKPYHDHEALPKTPQDLMRSRYSAYALTLPDYLIETTHKNNPKFQKNRAEWKASIKLFCTTTAFQGLTILASSHDPHTGSVTFHAHLRSISGEDLSFKEKSMFILEKGRWLYLSGELD